MVKCICKIFKIRYESKSKVKEEKQMKELKNLESLEAVYIYIYIYIYISVFYKLNKKKIKHKAILQYVNLVYLSCTS